MLAISMNLIFKMTSISKNARYALLEVLITSCAPQLTPHNTAQTTVVDGEDMVWNRDQYQKVCGLGLVYSIVGRK